MPFSQTQSHIIYIKEQCTGANYYGSPEGQPEHRPSAAKTGIQPHSAECGCIRLRLDFGHGHYSTCVRNE